MAEEAYASGPLTDEQKTIAQPIMDTFADNVCLMSGKYKGKDVAFLCQVEKSGEDIEMYPRFMVVTEDMLADCVNCEGQELEVVDG